MHDKAKLYRKTDIIIIQVPSHIQGNILIHSRNHNTTITCVHCTLYMANTILTSDDFWCHVPDSTNGIGESVFQFLGRTKVTQLEQ